MFLISEVFKEVFKCPFLFFRLPQKKKNLMKKKTNQKKRKNQIFFKPTVR